MILSTNCTTSDIFDHGCIIIPISIRICTDQDIRSVCKRNGCTITINNGCVSLCRVCRNIFFRYKNCIFCGLKIIFFCIEIVKIIVVIRIRILICTCSEYSKHQFCLCLIQCGRHSSLNHTESAGCIDSQDLRHNRCCTVNRCCDHIVIHCHRCCRRIKIVTWCCCVCTQCGAA